jgi:hypothetical protein
LDDDELLLTDRDVVGDLDSEGEVVGVFVDVVVGVADSEGVRLAVRERVGVADGDRRDGPTHAYVTVAHVRASSTASGNAAESSTLEARKQRVTVSGPCVPSMRRDVTSCVDEPDASVCTH